MIILHRIIWINEQALHGIQKNFSTKSEKEEKPKAIKRKRGNSNKFHRIYYSLELLVNAVRINNTLGGLLGKPSALSKEKTNTKKKNNINKCKINEPKARERKCHNTTISTPITIIVKTKYSGAFAHTLTEKKTTRRTSEKEEKKSNHNANIKQ